MRVSIIQQRAARRLTVVALFVPVTAAFLVVTLAGLVRSAEYRRKWDEVVDYFQAVGACWRLNGK